MFGLDLMALLVGGIVFAVTFLVLRVVALTVVASLKRTINEVISDNHRIDYLAQKIDRVQRDLHTVQAEFVSTDSINNLKESLQITDLYVAKISEMLDPVHSKGSATPATETTVKRRGRPRKSLQ